ncbi:MAG: hypothetical protein ACMX3H_04925 [Sodalis sp. (in: enterobacteria)]|uniref:hypothetical protein n=1 Tax=Sodalis sp. (in: enterobacteria) TaxID=1898979 RepID=UPI0039E2DFCE
MLPKSEKVIIDRADFYQHKLTDPIENIPPRFESLRKKLPHILNEIRIAKKNVMKAKKLFMRSAMFNKFHVLTYPDNHPVKAYLKQVLRTVDEEILDQSMNRFLFYLNEMEQYFDGPLDKIIIATCSTTNDRYLHNTLCPMVFSMPLDSGNRIVIMADAFDVQPIPTTKLHLTALHEASHRSDSVDFILSPTTRDAGDACEFMDVIDEALLNQYAEFIDNNSFFLKAYGHSIGRELNTDNVPWPIFHELIKRDPMLKANIVMDNADFIAIMISDIANNVKFNHNYRRARRPVRDVTSVVSDFTVPLLFRLVCSEIEAWSTGY